MPRRKGSERSSLPEEIKAAAWELIASQGAPALSLRAIARQLHITAPAIYNYFPRRDDLVTALIIDAYTSFGDSQLAARNAIPPDRLAERLEATGLAYRQWAIQYPQRYQLIFGTPIPGYQAPVERVMPSGARALSALASVVEDLRQAGMLKIENFPSITPGYEGLFSIWQEYCGGIDSTSLSVAILIWSQAHGLVSLEIAGNLPPFGPQGDALYRYAMASIKHIFILEVSS